MSIKTHLVVSLVVFVVVSTIAQSRFSSDEIYSRLPRGGDMLDHEEAALFQELILEGDKIFPDLIEVMKEHDDYLVYGDCLSIASSAPGDKSVIIDYIKDQVSEHEIAVDDGGVNFLFISCMALSRFGNENDIKCLFPLVDHSLKKVRLNAYLTIGEKGGKDALSLLQKKRISLTDVSEKRRLNDAIMSIEDRLRVQTASGPDLSLDKGARESIATEKIPESEVVSTGDESLRNVFSPDDAEGHRMNWRVLILAIFGIFVGFYFFKKNR